MELNSITIALQNNRCWCCCWDRMLKCHIFSLKYAFNFSPGTTPNPGMVPRRQGHHQCLLLFYNNKTTYFLRFSLFQKGYYSHDDFMMILLPTPHEKNAERIVMIKNTLTVCFTRVSQVLISDCRCKIQPRCCISSRGAKHVWWQ